MPVESVVGAVMYFVVVTSVVVLGAVCVYVLGASAVALFEALRRRRD